MIPLHGFLFIEPNRVTLRIYQQVHPNDWQILFQKRYTYENSLPGTITGIFSETKEYGVEVWKIYSHDIKRETSAKCSDLIKIKIENLPTTAIIDVLFSYFIHKELTLKKII